MEAVLRTAVLYVCLLAIFRLAGKRTMAHSGTFEIVVLLLVSEATEHALVGEDRSLTTSWLVTTTLVGLGILVAFVKQRSLRAQRVIDGLPTVLVDRGRLLRDRLAALHLDEEDIVEAAHGRGVARLDQVAYAILERNGRIAIIPKPEPRA